MTTATLDTSGLSPSCHHVTRFVKLVSPVPAVWSGGKKTEKTWVYKISKKSWNLEEEENKVSPRVRTRGILLSAHNVYQLDRAQDLWKKKLKKNSNESEMKKNPPNFETSYFPNLTQFVPTKRLEFLHNLVIHIRRVTSSSLEWSWK